MVVTENGIATADDARRIAYTREALRGLVAAAADGVDVRGYCHWSLLDNYEWGRWEPTFGLTLPADWPMSCAAAMRPVGWHWRSDGRGAAAGGPGADVVADRKSVV